MATYSAYRHIELDKVGAGKKRVLKPPGGGSSDIFGAAEPEKAPVARKLSTQSSIILTDEVNGTSGNGAGSETGSVKQGSETGSVKQGSETGSVKQASETGSVKQGSCNERLFGPPLGNNKMNGNAATNGKEESVADGPTHVNGNGIHKANGAGPAQPNAGTYSGRKRVPPGGFSSGLW